MANLLSAHRDLGNAAHRAEVARLWGVADVPARPGKTAVEMFEAAADGEIKALWIACTNPAQSMPDQATVRARARALRVRRRAGGVRHHRDLRLRRPAAAGDDLGREGRHRHQQRAAHQPRPRRPSPRPAKRATTGRSPPTSRAASRRGSVRGARDGARRCSPTRTPQSVWNEHREIDARPRPRHHRPELRRARRRAGAVAVARRRGRRQRSASTTTASSPPPTAARASSTRRTRRRPRRAMRAIRSRSTPGGCATSGTA